MAAYSLHFPPHLRCEVNLPTSKSISARAMILSSLAGGCELVGLSDCDDTKALQDALSLKLPTIDIGAAGTAMRFATAYFATREGEEHILTGSERMRNRPIGILVDALRDLGADIVYTEKEGYPPLLIKGKNLQGGALKISANVSSQYISALLMIAPMLQKGLQLHLQGVISSRPYIEMTLALMKRFGAAPYWMDDQTINVCPTGYIAPSAMHIEPDWSAASYWYEMVALSRDENASVLLRGLTRDSVQGDSIVVQLFEHLGVSTHFEKTGVRLTKCAMPTEKVWETDFSFCPDLAQTVITTSAILGKAFHFSGLHSLRIKETDRISALQTELRKLGYELNSYQKQNESLRDEILAYSPNYAPSDAPTVAINTYDDHRMAMAFAPCAIVCDGIVINDVEVVSKSYPNFWNDLRAIEVIIRYV